MQSKLLTPSLQDAELELCTNYGQTAVLHATNPILSRRPSADPMDLAFAPDSSALYDGVLWPFGLGAVVVYRNRSGKDAWQNFGQCRKHQPAQAAPTRKPFGGSVDFRVRLIEMVPDLRPTTAACSALLLRPGAWMFEEFRKSYMWTLHEADGCSTRVGVWLGNTASCDL